ncbi:SubName: Full=Uncharacterized protein {ECO:0000313/EMBL:CCA70782.1} [Serendipita indica DSM 11827]|nr:SubName: Full=Uncharacterized protein {ECO:0000313/EMBL:CCA70782.1} [Serendipita indica DSM 11827]
MSRDLIPGSDDEAELRLDLPESVVDGGSDIAVDTRGPSTVPGSPLADSPVQEIVPIARGNIVPVREKERKKRKSTSRDQIVELSDDDDEYNAKPKPKSRGRKAAVDNKEGNAKKNTKRATNKGRRASSIPESKTSAEDAANFEQLTHVSDENSDLGMDSNEGSVTYERRKSEDLGQLKVPKKRKSAAREENPKATKRRKTITIESDDEVQPPAPSARRNKRVVNSIVDPDTSPDELQIPDRRRSRSSKEPNPTQLTQPKPANPRVHRVSKSTSPSPDAPEQTEGHEDVDDPPVEANESTEVIVSDKVKVPSDQAKEPPVKPTPRLSNTFDSGHYIPKRGSVSDILRKTGLHSRLSSSKLTKGSTVKIAPLHLNRKTPPPPPVPIKKPQKAKNEDEEEEEPDFTGMTKKQIERYWEEKKYRAWFSP